MPIYTIQAPDGRIADIEGASPPTEADMQSIFASLPAKQTKQQQFPNMGKLAPETSLQKNIADPYASGVFGASEGIGAIPQGLVDLVNNIPLGSVVAPGTISFPTPSVKQLFPQATQSLDSALSNLGGKAFQALGFPTTPESPQIKNPNAAAVGDIAAQVAASFINPGGKAVGGALAPEGIAAKALQPGGTLSTGFRATARDLLTFIKNPTTDAEKAAIVQSADSGTLLGPAQEIAAIGKPKDVKQAIDLAGKAKEARGTQLDQLLNGDTGDTLLNVENVKQAAIDAVNNNPKLNVKGMESLKQRLLDKIESDYSQDWTARELFQQQKDLNALQKAALEKDKISRSTLLSGNPEKAAEDAARREISKVLDQYQQGVSGVADNPFRAYGQLSELENDLMGARNSAEIARSVRTAGGSNVAEAASKGKVSAIGEFIKKFGSDELDTLNDNVKKLFQRLPKAESPATLDQTVQQGLLNQAKQQPPVVTDLNRSILAQREAAQAAGEADLAKTQQQLTQQDLARIAEQGKAELATPEELSNYLTQEANRARTLIASQGVKGAIPPILAPQLEQAAAQDLRSLGEATQSDLNSYLNREANLTKAQKIAKAKAFASKLESDILKAIRANP